MTFVTVVNSTAHADETAEAIRAIEEIGGQLQSIQGAWEVDFHLRGRDLNDQGLMHVAKLKKVVWLNLRDTKVTDEGLARLRGLKALKYLHLERTAISDAGIQHLSDLPNLEYLNLYGTKITDQALETLKGNKGLKQLYVWRTEVTDQGVARLAKALPQLEIVRGMDLSKLPSSYPPETKQPQPKSSLEWIVVSNRRQAPARSENGINCQVIFVNKSAATVKLYWIGFGNGELKHYATLAAGEKRQQNSYSRHAWLVTDENERPLGYFIAGEDDAYAVIPMPYPQLRR